MVLFTDVIAFSAYLSDEYFLSEDERVPFDSVLTNEGGGYDPGRGSYSYVHIID